MPYHAGLVKRLGDLAALLDQVTREYNNELDPEEKEKIRLSVSAYLGKLHNLEEFAQNITIPKKHLPETDGTVREIFIRMLEKIDDSIFRDSAELAFIRLHESIRKQR